MKERKLTVVEHLTDLRSRLIVCIAGIAACSALCSVWAEDIMRLVTKPVGKLVFLAPQEAFVSYFKLSVISGIFLASPLIIYNAWRFVSEGLSGKEKKYLLFYGPVSLALFLSGGLFSFFVILPVAVRFLVGFGGDLLQPMISVKNYVSFAGMMALIFGIVFELPLVIVFLTKINIVTPEMLRSRRRYAIVAIFIIAAILTPPDIVTQTLMAVPLLILYEIGIILSGFVSPSKRNGYMEVENEKGAGES